MKKFTLSFIVFTSIHSLVFSGHQENILPGIETPLPPVFNNSSGKKCYSNSILSLLLFSSSKIRAYFEESQGALKKSPHPAHKALDQLLQCPHDKPLDATNLLTALGFDANEQQDAAECASVLCKRLEKLPELDTSHGNPLQTAFSVRYQDSVSCRYYLDNEIIPCKEETIFIRERILNTQTRDSLGESLKLFQNSTTDCTDCGEHRAQQKRNFINLPDILIINTINNQDKNIKFKLSDFRPSTTKQTSYKLFGVVLRQEGLGNSSGHYISLGINPDNKTWSIRNDEKIHPISEQQLNALAQGEALEVQGYQEFRPTMFFYNQEDKPALNIYSRLTKISHHIPLSKKPNVSWFAQHMSTNNAAPGKLELATID